MARAQPDARRGQGKKLEDIARALYEPAGQSETSDSGVRIPERARGSFEQAARCDVEIWRENVQAYEVFRRCRKLWRVGAMGGVLGLERAGLESLMNIMGIGKKRRLALLDAIEIMEDAALAVINRKNAS